MKQIHRMNIIPENYIYNSNKAILMYETISFLRIFYIPCGLVFFRIENIYHLVYPIGFGKDSTAPYCSKCISQKSIIYIFNDLYSTFAKLCSFHKTKPIRLQNLVILTQKSKGWC